MHQRTACQYGHVLLPLRRQSVHGCSLSFVLSLLHKLHCFCVRCPTSGKRVPLGRSRWGISPLCCSKSTHNSFCWCYPYQDAVPQCNAQPAHTRQWHEGVSKAKVCVYDNAVWKGIMQIDSAQIIGLGIKQRGPNFCFSSWQILPQSFKISQTVELKGIIIDSNQKVIFKPYWILVPTVGSNAKICFLFTYNEANILSEFTVWIPTRPPVC